MHLLVSGMRPTRLAVCLLTFIALMSISIPQSQATNIGLGTAKDFAVLALNGSYVFMGTATTIVNGDFGIGPNSFGDLEKGTIDGSLLLDTTSAANVTVNPAVTITGTTMTVDLSLPNSDAVMASTSFAALPVNRPDVTAITGSLLINGNGGDNVFSLTSVSLTAGTLTLNGSANDYFIFNVTGDLHFQASNIVLTGGVTAGHVIFNVIGALPGNAVDLGANGIFQGTILAPDRAIQADTLQVNGALIGGRDSSFDELSKTGASVSVHSSVTVNHQPFEESSGIGCISITKSVSPTKGSPGASVTYTFVVENCGALDLTISIMDTLLGDITGAFIADHGSDVLAAGASETFSVDSTIPGDKGDPVTNTVTVTGTADGTPYVDSAEASVTIPISISGGAYDDATCNGVYDPGVDLPLDGATFVLTDVSGNPVNDLDGNQVASQTGSTFSFTNLPPGVYKVTEINPVGYASTNAIPAGTGATKLTNDMIQVDATDSVFDFPGQIFLDGNCVTLLYQAYPGDSSGTNREFAGYLGFENDNTTSVPGVLQIIPQDGGEDPWANFIVDPDSETLNLVRMTKEEPAFDPCSTVARTVTQSGRNNIRLWWPLMYELPGTKWTLRVRTDVNNNTWTWQMDATLQSLKDTLQLFHETPFGRAQIPLVSDEQLYPVLQAKLDTAMSEINSGNLMQAGDTLDDFISEVSDAWIAATPMYPNPTGPGTGIAQTAENPAGCKLMADALYIEDKLGL